MVLRSHFPVLSCILWLPLICALSNVTVDSSDRTISYSPPSSWVSQGWDNRTSPPDPELANDGTWQYASTDATDDDGAMNNVSLTLTFSGNAVYVFAILQSQTFTAVDFVINGTHVGSYSRIPDTTSVFTYNTAVYANSTLPQGDHTFTLSLSQNDRSAFFFDYLVYSTNVQTPLVTNGNIAAPARSAPMPAGPGSTMFAFSETSQLPSTLASPSVSSTTTSGPPSDTPATTLAVQLDLSSSVILDASSSLDTSGSVDSSTSPAGSTVPATSPAHASSGSSRSNVVVIAAAAGSGGVVLILLVFIVCYIRYKRAKRYHIQPYVTPDTTPSNTPNDQDIFTKLPPSATSARSSSRPFLARLSFQTLAESTTTGITLTDEIFPLPSEVEDVFSQLEALSVEVQKFRETEEIIEERRSSLRVRSVTQDVHAGIDQLRTEIQRLRRRSGTNTGTGLSRMVDADLMRMLREVDMLRAELHEAVGQSDNDSTIERLPSYHSRKTVHVHTSDEVPPPLPNRRVLGADAKTRAT